MLTDRGILTRDHRTAHLVPGAEVIFPESIQALITARLDALSHERKTLLQDAAVVGKVFRARRARRDRTARRRDHPGRPAPPGPS